jgi:hypothetical protein
VTYTFLRTLYILLEMESLQMEAELECVNRVKRGTIIIIQYRSMKGCVRMEVTVGLREIKQYWKKKK